MAVRVTYTDSETGAIYTAAYLRIPPESLQLDFARQRGQFEVWAYFNTDARTAGKAQVAKRRFVIEGADFQTVFGNPAINRAFNYLKTLDEFKNGEDV